jgi:AraC-like DNA-binding protein
VQRRFRLRALPRAESWLRRNRERSRGKTRRLVQVCDVRARHRFGPTYAICLSLIGSSDWTGSLAPDQLSLILGAHVLRTYAALTPLGNAKKSGGLAPWQGKRAAEMMRERLHGKIPLSEAHECSLSVSHFTRAFRKSFGKSPYRWLLERRIDCAKALLMTGDLPIADIAIRSGFSDQAAFARAFGRIVGDSPGRWRRALSSRA